MTNFKVGDKIILKESDYYIKEIWYKFKIIDISPYNSYPIGAVYDNREYVFSEEYDVLEKITEDPIKLLFNHLKNIWMKKQM